jgi:hypothetical protein
VDILSAMHSLLHVCYFPMPPANHLCISNNPTKK